MRLPKSCPLSAALGDLAALLVLGDLAALVKAYFPVRMTDGDSGSSCTCSFELEHCGGSGTRSERDAADDCTVPSEGSAYVGHRYLVLSGRAPDIS